MDDQEMCKLLRDALGTDSESLITRVVESLANVDVIGLAVKDNTMEVWARPNTVTGGQLERLQAPFNVREIGVYGDPDLRDVEGELEGSFYMRLER